MGWSYNGALYCVDHEPDYKTAVASPNVESLDIPQPVFLDEITSHDVCDLCLIPLDA